MQASRWRWPSTSDVASAHPRQPEHGRDSLRAALTGRLGSENTEPGISCQADRTGLTGRKRNCNDGAAHAATHQSITSRRIGAIPETTIPEHLTHALQPSPTPCDSGLSGQLQQPKVKPRKTSHGHRTQAQHPSLTPLRFRPVRPAPSARGDNPGKPAKHPCRPVRPALSLTPATVRVGARDAGVKVALAEYQ